MWSLCMLFLLTNVVEAGIYRQNRCYSCMSPMYQEFFKNGLDRYFTQPKNFSYQCDEPMNPESMHLVSCRTICLTIKQDLYVMGQFGAATLGLFRTETSKKIILEAKALGQHYGGANNSSLSAISSFAEFSVPNEPGQPTGKRLFMRGCALTMARRGLNNHTLSMFDRYDICREMSAADLFRHDRADSQRVRVCSCLGDRCNGSLSGCQAPNIVVLLVLLLTCLLLR